MTILQVADLRFGYAGDTLFDNATFTLASGDRAALVAPNGSGKTTLLRIVAGELEADAGSSVVSRNATVGYYRQSHEIAAEGDVLGAFLSGFGEVVAARDELRRAEVDAASGSQAALDRLAHATDTYHLVGGDRLEHQVAALASNLGFSDQDLARPVSSLSGGERGRVRLGMVLAQEPDLLLLDEPTNHLDIETINWLERWLEDYRGAVLVVSHDRAFLDNVCSTTMELGRRNLRVYGNRYSEYVVLRADELDRERALVQRQRDMVDRTEDFIRRNIAGQKTKQAQSRRKMLEKLDKLENPEDVWQSAERLSFRFPPSARSGELVLEATGLGAERGGRVLFSGLDLLVRRGERIALVGPNGAGKSTLLKLLAARGAAEDRGVVKRGKNLQEGYFDQHLGEVEPRLTAVDNVRRIRGDFTVEAARHYLARFRFWGDDPLRTVSGFSGGERSRLALAKLLLEPRNLLFLDEPTNHLDIPAAEILEEALIGFEGTVVFASHDRRFLQNVATRVVSVRAGCADVYPGTFVDYQANRAKAQAATAHHAPSRATHQATANGAPSRAVNDAGTKTLDNDRREKHDARRLIARTAEKTKRRIAELEGEIAAGESRLTELRRALKDAPGDKWEELALMVAEEQALTRKVDTMLMEWARLSESAP
jgi:ATP-binding cassette subfamily F protein 3